jgi:cytochrome c oxidase assembly factor CtaG
MDADGMRTLAIITAALWLSMGRVLAHGDGAPPQRVEWTFDPWILTPLLVFATLYVAGTLVLRRRSRQRQSHTWQIALCCAGWLSLAASLVSPLHRLGEQLFTFHMIEHEIIMAISAPLLVLANPVGPLLWGLPRRIRVLAGRAMRHKAVSMSWRWLSQGSHATVLHGIAIWAWHAPALFDAAVTSVAVHRLQHLSFFLSAVLFWWSVFRRSEAGAAAWHVFLTMLHTSVLGALMALAPRVLYGVQTASASAWALTPLEDQQLAGIIMWVPAGTIYAGAALALSAIWIRQAGERTRHGDVAGAV